jgi:hypothetical protein
MLLMPLIPGAPVQLGRAASVSGALWEWFAENLLVCCTTQGDKKGAPMIDLCAEEFRASGGRGKKRWRRAAWVKYTRIVVLTW